jgi:hypothetical protein
VACHASDGVDSPVPRWSNSTTSPTARNGARRESPSGAMAV